MKKNKKIKIYSTILVVFIVFVLIFNQALLKLKINLDNLFLPIQSKIYIFSSKLIEIKEVIFSYENTINENSELKRENIKLKYVNETYEEILKENERLVKLLEIKENEKLKKKLRFARVIFQNINNLNKKFYIDLGLDDDIEKDMIVLYNDYLVGRVSEIYENYSMVTMLTDSRSKISAKSENNILGIIQGNENDDGTMYFTPSTFEENLEENQEIYTSGISDIYPEGIKLGTILKIDKTENNLFKSIKVKAGFKSTDLKEVVLYKKDNILEKNKGKK